MQAAIRTTAQLSYVLVLALPLAGVALAAARRAADLVASGDRLAACVGVAAGRPRPRVAEVLVALAGVALADLVALVVTLALPSLAARGVGVM